MDIDFSFLHREKDVHKNNCGRVLVVAGSRGMTGAAMLASRAALRTGAGYVRLVLPRSLVPFVDPAIPEVVTLGAPETRAGTLSKNAIDIVRKYMEASDALAIGPGLSTHTATQALVRRLLALWNKPAVIDADALIDCPYNDRTTAPPLHILTPHPGEMARMMHVTVSAVQSDREAIAKAAATRFGAIVVLKGHRTVVTDGTQVHINDTGNPGMATAGMGDVLTGVIASLLAQGLTPWSAACTGAHLHGLAGDIAYTKKGIGLIAGDVVKCLGNAMIRIQFVSCDYLG